MKARHPLIHLSWVRHQPRGMFGSVMAAIASLWFVVGAALFMFYEMRAVDQINMQRQKLLVEHNKQGTVASADQIRQLNEEVKAANQHSLMLNTPWDRIFRALRVPQTVNVLLTGFETSARNNVLTITGEAVSFDEAIGYIALLSERQTFKSVQLIKHEFPKGSDANASTRIRFMLEATWAY